MQIQKFQNIWNLCNPVRALILPIQNFVKNAILLLYAYRFVTKYHLMTFLALSPGSHYIQYLLYRKWRMREDYISPPRRLGSRFSISKQLRRWRGRWRCCSCSPWLAPTSINRNGHWQGMAPADSLFYKVRHHLVKRVWLDWSYKLCPCGLEMCPTFNSNTTWTKITTKPFSTRWCPTQYSRWLSRPPKYGTDDNVDDWRQWRPKGQ